MTDDSARCKITFPIEGGRLTCGRARRSIQMYCWERGYTMKVEEDRGLLRTAMCFTIITPAAEGDQVLAELRAWASQFGDDRS
jgi:hypothetical protein